RARQRQPRPLAQPAAHLRHVAAAALTPGRLRASAWASLPAVEAPRPADQSTRPKAVLPPSGGLRSVGRAQSAAVAVRPASAVLAVPTRSRAATARVSSIVRTQIGRV